ncbi:hypothetical protein Acor_06800 [Acrocarpospora corrugata]|uniref:Uncharacterized protein n=1 Tax=Acrocarpospora corrugata TaxID=35763 RepID=A0A5M3VR01_9ACTN|nr:hypothetical protein [Acrocarpospora corrugata]GER98618.1 hypothetical protein Acor_06800 [Acrocarpospora corrugata]
MKFADIQRRADRLHIITLVTGAAAFISALALPIHVAWRLLIAALIAVIGSAYVHLAQKKMRLNLRRVEEEEWAAKWEDPEIPGSEDATSVRP